MWRRTGWRKLLALASLLLFIIIIVVLADVNPVAVFDPPYLALALNICFLALVPLSVVYLAQKSFISKSSAGMLFCASGMTAFAISGLAAPLIMNQPGNVNASITIHNMGTTLAALLLLTGALLFLFKPGAATRSNHADLLVIMSNFAILLAMAAIIFFSLNDMFPPFFAQGTGPTSLRQDVLQCGTIMMAAASIIFIFLYGRSKSDFPFWFGMALALITISFCAFLMQKSVGSPEGWAGRIAQYLGSTYLLISIISVTRSSMKKQITPEREISSAFSYSEADYSALVEMATDAIISCDEKGKVQTWNRAAEKMFGFSAQEASGASLPLLIAPPEVAADISGLLQSAATAKNGTVTGMIEVQGQHKGGRTFPMEVTAASSKVAGRPITTFVARDFTERRKAEEKLSESEARHRTVVENAGEIILVAQDGLVKFANPMTLRVLGYPPDEAGKVLLHPFLKFIHPDDAEMVANNYARRLKGEDLPPTYDFRIIDRHGKVRWMELNAVVTGWEGKPATLNFLRDITARKQAENAMQESEEKFRNVFDYSTVGKSITSPDGRVSVNQALADMLGYTTGELESVNWMDITFPDDIEASALQRDLLLSGERRSIRMEKRYVKKGGPVIWADVSMVLQRDTAGQPLYFITSVIDITDRKHIEMELKNAGGMLALAQEASGSGAWAWDMASGQLTWSPELFKLFGLDPLQDSANFDTWRAILHPDDRQAAEDTVNNSVRDRTKLFNEYRIVRPDGEARWIHAWGNTEYDKQGNAVSMAGLCMDVTDQKRVQDDLRASEDRYGQLFQRMSSAVAVYRVVDGGADFVFTDFNRSAEIIDNIRREEVIGKRVTEAFPGVREFGLYEVLQRVWKTGQPEYLPANIYRDERQSDAWRENWVYRLPGGEVVAIYNDVTERKHAEETILQSKLLLQNVIDSTPDWIYVKDSEHRYLMANRSFASSQGAGPQDMIGKLDTDFFSKELCLGNPQRGISGYHHDDAEALQGRTVHIPKNIITWADGSEHIYDSYKLPLKDRSGATYGVLVYSRDITERAILEQEREDNLHLLREALGSTIDAMSSVVEMRDPYTAGHQQRVAQLTDAIAREMGFEEERRENLVMAAKVHDIGKMYVPADILSKPGKVSPIELTLIHTHAEGSYNILKNIQTRGPLAEIVHQHHERIDGSGYPRGLRGMKILPEASILAVADVVEAMASHRPYRPALGISKALEEIENGRGTLYDTGVVDACTRLFREGRFKFDG